MTGKRRVGLTFIDGVVTGPLGLREVTFLVDTGAQYSLLPHDDTFLAHRLARPRQWILATRFRWL